MQVTHDLITDLIPVYLSGEASPGTKTLVEEYLRQHPETAVELKTQWSEAAAAVPVPPELELRTLRRTRRLITLRGWLLGLAIFLTLLPGTFADVYGTRYSLSQSFPVAAGFVFLAGIAFWVGWFVVGRRLRAT